MRVLLRELEADLVEQVLTESLDAVESYGAPGGCPTCHDGERRERVAKAAQQA